MTLTGVTAGSTLVIGLLQAGSAIRNYRVNPLDGKGWHRPVFLNPSQAIAVFILEGVTAGNHSITVTPNSGSSFVFLVFELGGVPRVALDTFSVLDESVNSNSHISAASGTVIDTAADVVIICGGVLSSSASTTVPGTGYTSAHSDAANGYHFQYLTSASPLTDEQGAWAHTGTARQSLGFIISLKTAAALATLPDAIGPITEEIWTAPIRTLETPAALVPPDLVGSPVEAGFSTLSEWATTIPNGFSQGNAVIAAVTQIQSIYRTPYRLKAGMISFQKIISVPLGTFAYIDIFAAFNVVALAPGESISLQWNSTSSGRLIVQELTPSEFRGLSMEADSKGEVAASFNLVCGATGVVADPNAFIFAVGTTHGSGDLTPGVNYTRLGADRSSDQTLFMYRKTSSGVSGDQAPYSSSVSRVGNGAMAVFYSTRPLPETNQEFIAKSVWEYPTRTVEIFIVRPNETAVAGDWTVIGAASLILAINDDSDTSYIKSGTPGTRTIELLEGATVRATRTLTPGASFAEESFTLTGPEQASITDWSNIRIRIIEGGTPHETKFPAMLTPSIPVSIHLRTKEEV